MPASHQSFVRLLPLTPKLQAHVLNFKLMFKYMLIFKNSWGTLVGCVLASLGRSLVRVKILRGAPLGAKIILVFQKRWFRWVKMQIQNLLVGQSSPDFFCQRVRNCCQYISFPVSDILICSGDIRNQSEIAWNFACFYKNFWGRPPNFNFGTWIIKLNQLPIT